MATFDPAQPVGDARHEVSEADARQVRILKFVVVFLGVLLLVGFAVVIGRIAYLAMQPAGGIGTVPQAQNVTIDLPSGATIRQTTVSGDRMTVQYEHHDQMGIVIINLTTGRVVSRLTFRPEAPSR
ncbi:MAG: DUF6476 family protein [Hyphomicrobiaceae bacterium]|jgi:hypothetical protein|nr:MAG: hypothetical protein DIU57_06835 [Pseudomonadota bacterium]